MAGLSTLDRFLPVWIGVAMAAGLRWAGSCPTSTHWRIKVATVSLPIALGLLVMMYPVLAKVRYDELGHVTADRRLLVASIVLNWLVGPALMFALAWLLLPDLPEYRTGLIIVGLARCIAMVLIWNDLACGDREAAAILVAINSVFQIVAFAGLGWFYLDVLPGWLGLGDEGVGGADGGLDVSVWSIAVSVLIFLGIPLLAGFLTRHLGERARGTRVVRSNSSCHASDRSPCTGCCSRSSSCSPCRATRSPRTRSMSPASPCRCSPTSPSCGAVSFLLGAPRSG